MTAAEWRRFIEVGGLRQFEPRRNPAMWSIWGDGKDPLFEGTEADTKAEYLRKYKDSESAYVEDPEGNGYIYMDEEWVPA